MKKIAALFILFLSLNIAYSQIGGKIIDTTEITVSGVKFSIGDTILLGLPSGGVSGFIYIYQPANLWIGTPQQNVPSSQTGLSYTIKEFRKLGSNKTGWKTVAVIETSIINGVIDLAPAILTKEIIAINNKTIQN